MSKIFTNLHNRAAGLLLATGLGLALAAPVTPLAAQENQISISAAAYGATRKLEISINKTVMVDLPAGAAEVIVSQPEVAATIMRTRTRALVQGVTGGDTNIFFLDDRGQTISILEVKVIEEPSQVGNALELALARVIPGSNINVESIALGETNRVVLTGTVLTAEDSDRAMMVAVQFAGGMENVASLIDINGPKQVMLQVTVSEVKRDIAKQFGINLGAAFNVGTTNLFSFVNTMIDPEIPHGGGVSGGNVNAAIRALEQRGALRVLAQPTLTAISGESAEFPRRRRDALLHL
jgi:pilus assembly protein CpaC